MSPEEDAAGAAKKATSRPSSSPRRAATGARLKRGSGSPFGRPRWAQTTTLAPASNSCRSCGRLARIRPSSVMTLFSSGPSSGTLRSDRTRTRLPPTSPRASTPGSRDVTSRLGQTAGHQCGQIGEPAGISPLVVIPADDLHLRPLRHRQLRVEGARRRRADDVARDDRVVGVVEEPLQLTLGRLLVGGVDLFLARLA